MTAPEFADDTAPGATTNPPEAGAEHVADLHVDEADTGAWLEDFTGLLYTGALTGWFDWTGHRVTIKTLTTNEELLVAQLTSQYEGGMGGMKAYATAMSGLCVTSIDGKPMPAPIGEDPNATHRWALDRFNFAQRWYPPTIDAILDAYLQLETRQREVLAGLGKASARQGGATRGLSARSASQTAGAS